MQVGAARARVRALTSGSALRRAHGAGALGLHRACPVMPYAHALLKPSAVDIRSLVAPRLGHGCAVKTWATAPRLERGGAHVLDRERCGEQPLARPEHNREDDKAVLVDQSRLDERSSESDASHREQVPARALLLSARDDVRQLFPVAIVVSAHLR